MIATIDYIGHASSRWIEIINFSPNGKYLAVGNHDSTIYIYDTVHYKHLHSLHGHTAAILDIDWSDDSQYIRTFSLSYDILYYNPAKGVRITDAEPLKDYKWETQTCLQGYNVTGIWNSSYGSVNDINNITANKD